jgi:hypothetical protein
MARDPSRNRDSFGTIRPAIRWRFAIPYGDTTAFRSFWGLSVPSERKNTAKTAETAIHSVTRSVSRKPDTARRQNRILFGFFAIS